MSISILNIIIRDDKKITLCLSIINDKNMKFLNVSNCIRNVIIKYIKNSEAISQ